MEKKLTFVFALKENPRGRFLRITEDVSGRRDTIIIPAPGLEDFTLVRERILDPGLQERCQLWLSEADGRQWKRGLAIRYRDPGRGR